MTLNETDNSLAIELEPSVSAKRSVIWLHGLGADGSDFVPLAAELKLPSPLGIRFIFPHAPIMPVTMNNGYRMRAWFDIYERKIDAEIDEKGIAQSTNLIHKLINNEVKRGIKTSDIVLAGFSQGSVIALTAGLCYPEPLAGIIALSGYLPLATEVLERATPANRQIPIFIAHGTEDAIVHYALGKATYSVLKTANYPVTWRSYNMGHEVCAQETADISSWLQEIFNS